MNTDPDGDGFVNDVTQADMTAISLYQAAMPVPGRVIPNDPYIEQAVLTGERVFDKIGCARCFSLIEFLKTLQLLPPNTHHPIVDEHFEPKVWPPPQERPIRETNVRD